MQREQQFGRRPVGAMDGEAPAELVGLGADLRAMTGDARLVFALPGLGAAGGDGARALGLDELDATGIGKGFFRRIDDLHGVAVGAGCRELSEGGAHLRHRLQKSDTTTISASAEGANSGGRLGRSATSCTIAFAILSSTLRLPVGRISPGMPTRSPAWTRISASAKATTRHRSSLDSWARCERNTMDGERSGHSHTVCAASHSRSRT